MKLFESCIFYIFSFLSIFSITCFAFSKKTNQQTLFLMVFFICLAFFNLVLNSTFNAVFFLLLNVFLFSLVFHFVSFYYNLNNAEKFKLNHLKMSAFMILFFIILTISLLLTSNLKIPFIVSPQKCLGIETSNTISTVLLSKYFIIYTLVPVFLLVITIFTGVLFFRNKKIKQRRKI